MLSVALKLEKNSPLSEEEKETDWNYLDLSCAVIAGFGNEKNFIMLRFLLGKYSNHL